MNDARTMPFRRITVEAFTIVASILLAFSIDAWWGDRESHKELELELANVKSELQENRRRVALEIFLLERITSAGNSLIGTMTANQDATTITVPDSLAWLTTVWSPTLDASFGAVDALVSSGRLAEVEDPALRSGLAGIRARFEDTQEEEQTARMVQYSLFFPLLIDKVDLHALYRYDDKYFSKVRYSDEALPTDGNVEYPNSLAIRNTILDRMGWLRTGHDEMSVLLEEIDRLIDLLQSNQSAKS